MELPKLVCPNCGYTWTPRKQRPKKCPKCQHWLPKEVFEEEEE